MIPTVAQAKALWQTYHLPITKQHHSLLVALVSRTFAVYLERYTDIRIQKDLLFVGALLHDIDKKMPNLPGETHPDVVVRVLSDLGYKEVAVLVKTHPLHAILDEQIAPKEWEEKLLFLADKMTKYDVITVDERFRLWNDEYLPIKDQRILDAAYPKVKRLEQEVFHLAHLTSEEVIKIVKNDILHQEGDIL